MSAGERDFSTISEIFAPVLPDRIQHQHHRMRGSDLVVPVGPNEEEMSQLRVSDEMLQKLNCRGIQPLQVVDEERERVLFLSTCGKKSSKYVVNTVPRFVGRKIRNRRLLADD